MKSDSLAFNRVYRMGESAGVNYTVRYAQYRPLIDSLAEELGTLLEKKVYRLVILGGKTFGEAGAVLGIRKRAAMLELLAKDGLASKIKARLTEMNIISDNQMNEVAGV